MDVKGWPLDKIMQLPDHCFGQRWPVCIAALGLSPDVGWYISEMTLPEWCVVWSLFYIHGGDSFTLSVVQLSLGDKIPSGDAEFDACEPLLPGFGYYDGLRRYISLNRYGGFIDLPMRKPIHTAGRRLIARFVWPGAMVYPSVAGIVISSLPSEVPDCLFSR